VKATHEQTDDQISDDRVVPEEEEEDDNVSEISGLSDISITGAGRWHPMKGLSHLLYSVSCLLDFFSAVISFLINTKYVHFSAVQIVFFSL